MTLFPRAALHSQLASVTRRNVLARHIHSSPLRAAVAHPVTAHGPPPKAPAPAEAFQDAQQQKQQTNAASSSAESTPSQPARPTASLKKRFWKDVHVHGKPGMFILIDLIQRRLVSSQSIYLPGRYQLPNHHIFPASSPSP